MFFLKIVRQGFGILPETKKWRGMKAVITTVVFATLMMLPYSAFAQSRGDNLWGFTGPTDMDVRGIFIGGRYTRTQVQARWGVPTQHISHMTDRGLVEEYTYGSQPLHNTFRFGENGFFHTFVIASRDFSVYTARSGGIRVGERMIF